MATEYYIAAKIDPSGASQGAQKVKQELGGISTAAGATQRAMTDAVGGSQVSKTIEDTSRNLSDLRGQLTSIGSAGSTAAKGINTATAAANENDKQNRRNAYGLQQLGTQFGDFTTQISLGANVFQAFGAQAGQAAFAAKDMGGVVGRVGNYLAGPWGSLILAGVTILGTLGLKFLEAGDDSEIAEKQMKKFQDRQMDLANFIDATTGSLKEQSAALRQNAIDARNAAIIFNGIKQGNIRQEALQRAGSTALFGGGGQPLIDAINRSGGDPDKLADEVTKLSKTTPALTGLRVQLTQLAAQYDLASKESAKFANENDLISGKVKRNSKSIIDARVDEATADGAVAKARARLQEVELAGAAADAMENGPERNRLLAEYERNRTAANKAINAATQAEKGARKATAESNAEVREANTLAKKRAEEAKQQAQFIERLQNQNKALETRGTQGAIDQQTAAFRTQFRTGPSPTQQKDIEDAVRQNQLLSDEKTILDNVLGPLESYNRSVAALNDLLAKGKISQAEFNRELADLPLNKAVENIDAQLAATSGNLDTQIAAIDKSIQKLLDDVDRAEKAGILSKEDADARRNAIGTPAVPGDITVAGNVDRPVTSMRDRQVRELQRQRRDKLNQIDQGLGGQLGRDAESDDLKNKYATQLQDLADFYGGCFDQDEEYQKRKSALDKKYALDQFHIDQARKDQQLGSAQDIAGSLLSITEDFAGKNNAIYKGIFIAEKAIAIARSIVAIQTGLAEAAAKPFPFNLGAIASVAAATASIISNIQQVSVNFADGGFVRGPGGPRDDLINANLSNGEHVTNAAAVAAGDNAALLDAVNSGRYVYRRGASNDNAGGGGIGGGGGGNVTVHNYSGAPVETRQSENGDLEITVLRLINGHAGKAVARELGNPNSAPSRAITGHTTARRKRP